MTQEGQRPGTGSPVGSDLGRNKDSMGRGQNLGLFEDRCDSVEERGVSCHSKGCELGQVDDRTRGCQLGQIFPGDTVHWYDQLGPFSKVYFAVGRQKAVFCPQSTDLFSLPPSQGCLSVFFSCLLFFPPSTEA